MMQISLKTQISANAQTDLSFRWVHLFEGTFPDVVTHIKSLS